VSSIPFDGRGPRPFVIAVYTDGQLRSSILDCPFRRFEETCAISKHSRRARKTGPTHPLAVLHCSVHDRYFSVYPPEFTPYARRQLIEGPAQYRAASLMQAVDRAAEEGPVDREPTGGPSWSTQNRLLERVSALFGLHGEQRRQEVSTLVGLPLMDLDSAARTRGVQPRARVLQRLREGLDADELLGLGALAGLWGPPHRWLEHRDQLVPLGLSP
jgi:hypothetical protein